MKTFIIGKDSLLTNCILNYDKKAKAFSARNLSDSDKIFDNLKKEKKINIIFNNFYPSSKISDIVAEDYQKFYNQSLIFNAKILSKINPKIINKIIYSSSSSVYNSIKTDYKRPDLNNRGLYSSTKIAAESLFYNFASKNNISFNIVRIFNMYSENNDKFSIISKIFKIIDQKKILVVKNKGEGIRDFIHVKDVAKIIIFLLNYKKLKQNTLDVGTGNGIRIKDLLNFIGKKNIKIKYEKNFVEEVDVSIANNILNRNFISLEKILKKKIIPSLPILNLNKIQKKNIIQEIISDYVIYGAGNAGKQVLKQLKNENKKVLYFVDDRIKSNHVSGVRVLSRKDFFDLATVKIFKNLIIAIPSLSKKKYHHLRNLFAPYIENIFGVPLKTQLQTNIISLADLNVYDTESILNRKFSTINFSIFNNELRNKNILITGAGGSIGSQLARTLLNTNCAKIIGIDNSETSLFNFIKEMKSFKKVTLILGDIKDIKNLNQIIKKYKISIILHAAAFKHVNILENNIYPAIQNNILGTKNILDCAIENNLKVVVVSTDKAAKPTSVLGLTKRVSELLSIEYNSKSKNNNIKVVRFGNVFGSAGSAIPIFLDQINKGVPVTITDRFASRYFMTANEACFLILSSLKINDSSNILIFDMGKPIKILDVVNKLINIKKEYEPLFEANIKEIGLQKGEKLNETLSINRLKKSNIKGIFISNEPKYDSSKINNLIDRLKKNNNSNRLKLILSEFLKKEL